MGRGHHCGQHAWGGCDGGSHGAAAMVMSKQQSRPPGEQQDPPWLPMASSMAALPEFVL